MSESQAKSSRKLKVDVQPSGDDRKGARRGAIFIGCALIAFVIYLIVTGQVAQFMAALANVQIPWLLVASLCMLLYLILGIAAYAIAVWLDPNSPVGIRDLISVEASGIFFGNLTPMMMGSTPAQIYRLTKAGQNVGEAGATQFTRFIVYQFGLVVWGGILLAARMPFFVERYSDIGALTILCIFSFGGHVGILLLIFAIALMPKTVIRVAHWGLSLLERMGIAREKVREWRGFVDGEVYSFSEKFKLAAGHTSSMAITVLITMLQLAFFYLVPYFLMLAFGHHDVDFLSVMAASAFVQLLSSAVPLPGGTGGAEGGFALFLGHFYGSASTAGYLLWRLITFIIPTIVAAPLLGIKSAHHASIHQRWDRLMARFGRKPRKASRKKKTAGAQEEPAGEHRTRRRVRQTPGGITVSPRELEHRGRRER
ncbi:MAG: flippase-like domain-containing protein [Coriobacteriaceae bacterium]|nr:flippase-like domain-containing protein [Coriobacteriaceae bacterium]